MKLLPIFYLLAIFILSCSDSSPQIERLVSAPHQPIKPEVAIPPESDSCRANMGDPFKCVRERCANIGGAYDAEFSLCRCPNTSQVFSAARTGACLDSSDIHTTFFYIGSNRVTSGKNMQLPILPFEIFRTEVLHDYNSQLAPSLRSNLLISEIRLTLDYISRGLERYYWEPDSSRWPNIIEHRPHASLPELNLQQYPFVAEAWRYVRTQVRDAKPISKLFTEDGCAGHCIIEQLYPPFKGHKISETIQYAGGVSVRRQVYIEKDVKLPYHEDYVIIEVDPSLSPNLIYKFKVYIDSASGDLVREVRTHSRRGKLLDSDKQILQPNFRSELDLRHSAEQKSTSSVVVCDTGFLPSNGVKFRLGPYLNESFWGWMRPASGQRLTLADKLSGVMSLVEMNLFNREDQMVERHGESISHLATVNAPLSAIPMNLEQCFSDYLNWKDDVKAHAKVINVSALFYYDSFSCENASLFGNTIGDPQQPFLWVLGAGNSLKHDLTRIHSTYCPQSLGGRDNIIVVTSDALRANKGNDYADIMTDGSGYFSDESGTSYAAPRVSRVAAILASEFPSLTIAEIRKAILDGARVPTPRLPVRSGGYLDEEGARRVAQKLATAI
ncbi:MAG: S8 family serine peptidase [Myxococcota bacterium]